MRMYEPHHLHHTLQQPLIDLHAYTYGLLFPLTKVKNNDECSFNLGAHVYSHVHITLSVNSS